MSPLDHSPAHILQAVLIRLGGAGDPNASPLPDWPCYVDSEPSSPDDCLTVYNTQGRKGARLQPTGQSHVYPGVQLRVRSVMPKAAYDKINALAVALDELYDEAVTIDSTDYLLGSANRAGDPIRVGPTLPESKRVAYTLNALLVVTKRP